MMPLAPPVGDRNPNDRSAQDILAALQGRTGSRRWTFRYELLDSAGTWLMDLDNVLGSTVSQNWLADIKRTASFTLRESGVINYLSDRIRPNVRLHLPPYGTGDYVEWPQGVFLLSTPSRRVDPAGAVTREVEGYDQLQVYADDLVTDRYTVAAGTNVITAALTVVGSVLIPPPVNATPHAGVLASAREWEPGTSKLRIINELLGMVNYESLSFDEVGQAQIQPYQPPGQRAPEYNYEDDQNGLVMPDVEQVMDLFSIPNRWVLVVSEPDQNPLISTYTNTDPASPTSTVRRQRVITDFRTEQEAVTQAVLDAKAARLAFESSQVYEAVPFRTGLMPIHSGNDVYRLRLNSLAINAIYAEHSWKMTLRAGAPMEHVARRVVTV